jgi:hypothetical protein
MMSAMGVRALRPTPPFFVLDSGGRDTPTASLIRHVRNPIWSLGSIENPSQYWHEVQSCISTECCRTGQNTVSATSESPPSCAVRRTWMSTRRGSSFRVVIVEPRIPATAGSEPPAESARREVVAARFGRLGPSAGSR